MNWQEIVKQNNLSVSIINLKQLNLATRIDAEHYQQHFLDIIDTVKKKNNKRLAEIVAKPITTGHTPSMQEESYYGGDTKFIKTDNLRDNIINEDFNHFLSDKGTQKLKNALLQPDDVIVTIIGANYSVVGRVARVFDDLGKSAINQNISLIRPKIKSGYLTTFLTGQYGKQQLYYLSRQTEQVNLNNVEVADVIVPIPSDDFEEKIHKIHSETHELQIKAKSLYQQAEALLLSELGLADYVPNEANTSIRDLFECLQDDRFDAEYWMPKYDEILNKIPQFKTLGEIAQVKKGSLINPKYYSEDGTPYIRGGDFSANELSTESMIYISPTFSRNNETVVQENDIVFASIGSVGKTAIVTKEFSGSFISNNIGRIHINNIDFMPQYVQICLQSMICQLQFERLQTQTAQPKILDSNIRKIKIPFLIKEKQLVISDLVIQSRQQKEQSKHLLEKAKRAVEIFIEQDEEKALEYLAT